MLHHPLSAPFTNHRISEDWLNLLPPFVTRSSFRYMTRYLHLFLMSRWCSLFSYYIIFNVLHVIMSQESLYVHYIPTLYYSTPWWCSMSSIQTHTCCIHYRVQHWLYLHLKWLQFIFISILFGGFVPCVCVSGVCMFGNGNWRRENMFFVYLVFVAVENDSIIYGTLLMLATYVCLLRCCVWGGERGRKDGRNGNATRYFCLN